MQMPEGRSNELNQPKEMSDWFSPDEMIGMSNKIVLKDVVVVGLELFGSSVLSP